MAPAAGLQRHRSFLALTARYLWSRRVDQKSKMELFAECIQYFCKLPSSYLTSNLKMMIAENFRINFIHIWNHPARMQTWGKNFVDKNTIKILINYNFFNQISAIILAQKVHPSLEKIYFWCILEMPVINQYFLERTPWRKNWRPSPAQAANFSYKIRTAPCSYHNLLGVARG